MSADYEINKGIGRSLEFKGIKAQYIMYLAGGLVALLLLFAILHMMGCSAYACLGITVPSGAALVFYVQHMSKKYGEHGLTKKVAAGRLPGALLSPSRQHFIQLKTTDNAQK